MTLVSVIITTYNRCDSLALAIESARASANEIEIVVVDDASTDQTESMCRELYDIIYVRLPVNSKTAAARNAGIAASTGKYIAFLDDDDRRLPGSLSTQVEKLEAGGFALVYGRARCVDKAGEETGILPGICPEGDIYEDLLRSNFLVLSTCVARRSALDEVGGFDESPEFYGIEDWDLWLRLAHDHSVGGVTEPVAIYQMPEADSRQWSSDIAGQFTRVANAYSKKWLKMSRAQKLIREGRLKKGEVLKPVADRILYGLCKRPSKSFEDARRLMAILKCSPRILVEANFYKSIFKSAIFRDAR